VDPKTLRQITLPTTARLREAMQVFSESAVHTCGRGFGIVVDEAGRCVAVVTDGDIRRSLLAHGDMDAPITVAMNRGFASSRQGDSAHTILRLFDQRVRVLPVLDSAGRPVDVLCYGDFSVAAHAEQRIIRARAPVRVSFAGGGTDTSYSIRSQTGVVLSSTINKYAYATILVRPDHQVRIVSRDYRSEVEAASVQDLRYDGTLDLIKACAKLMDPGFGFDLETYSEVEPGTGLGGSSAVAVAVIGALNHFRHENHLDRYHIADLAYQAERIELDIAGGWQDQYASAFGGLSLIEFRQDEILVFPISLQPDLMLELRANLLLFRVGPSRSSGTIHDDQRRRFASDDRLHEYYGALTRLAVAMKEAVAKGDLRLFGQLLHQGWEAKKRLSDGISNPEIDGLYEAARRCGALGGKLLGAGGGGYLMFYCSPSHHVSVIDRLSAMGARYETFDFVQTGLQTWTTRR
jgi:D-glycero-alpha-D-manno-heptose-7-phosphate kinase